MKLTSLATLAVIVAASSPVLAETSKGVEVGILNCQLSADSNAIIYSDAEYMCTLKAANDSLVDGIYIGKIKRLGLDFEWKAEETLAWAVVALTDNVKNGPIAGEYVGVGADAALGLGIGGNVLVGGLDKSFALQPVSLAAAEGVGASIGIEEMTLTYKGEVIK